MTTPRADGGDWSHWRVPIGPFDPAWTLGSTKATGGNKTINNVMYVDPTFHQIMNWMSPAKYRGAFHWLVSNTTVKDQADHFIAEMRRYTGTQHLPAGLFVQLDWETTPNITVPTSDMAIEWADRVEQEYNRECVITYSSDWLPDSTLDADSRAEFDEWRNVMPDAPLWFANYRTGDGPNDGWAECAKYGASLWQWTSTYSHPSFTAGIDMNYVFNYGTLDRITNQKAVQPMKAYRLYDSRQHKPLAAGEVRTVPVMASWVLVNIAVVDPADSGYLVAWSGSTTNTSNVNFKEGVTISNLAKVFLEGGNLELQATAACHVIVDVQDAG